MSGWISLDRAITKHWLWQDEKFTKGQAWVDLLLWAAHTPHKVLLKGTLIPVSRGEQIRSQVTLAKAWNWDRKTVSRFLKLLEKDGMIISRVDHLTSYISICNYDSFQDNYKDSTQLKGQLKGQQAPTREDTNNKVNKENNDNNNNATSRFGEFWDIYNKKVDSKKCKAKFDKLKQSEIEHIFKSLPIYINSTPDPKFRKNPLTWLNGKCWNDEQEDNQEQLIDYGSVIEIFNESMRRYKEVPKALDTTTGRIRMINSLVQVRGMNIDGFKRYFDHISNNDQLQYFLTGEKIPARGIDHFLKDDVFMNIKEAKVAR